MKIKHMLVESAKKGLLGRKIQLKIFLRYNSIKKSLFAKGTITPEVIKTAKQLRSEYDSIKIYGILFSNRIGELISRYLMFRRINSESTNSKVLNLVFVWEDDQCNTRLLEMMENSGLVIDANNRDEWIYILSRQRKVDFSSFYELSDRNIDYHRYDPKDTKEWFIFSDDQIEEGNKKMIEMGVIEPFVCIANRDDKYLLETGYTEIAHHCHRNSDIQTRTLAIDYLYKNGIQTVRMGRIVCGKIGHEGCIDYANEFYDELMDLYLSYKCKFYVCDCGGIMLPAESMDKSMVYTNCIEFAIPGWGAMPQHYDDIMIPKKVYSIKENRYLNLKELIYIQSISNGDGSIYKNMNLRLEENTPQEIYDVVREMNERIDGTWIDTPEDNNRQQVFQERMNLYIKENNIDRRVTYLGRIGSDYLRENWDVLM